MISEFGYGILVGMVIGSFVAVVVMSWMHAASAADDRVRIVDEWDPREPYSPPTTPEPPMTPPPKHRR